MGSLYTRTLRWDIDPDEHVKIYVTHVGLYMNEDVVMCKTFLATLRGPTLEWFTPLSLLNVRQEKDGMLRAFIDRFGKMVFRM